MDMGPRQAIRAVQLGLRDEVLSCNTMWVCLQCHTCSARCPLEIDIARVMEALRLLAVMEGHDSAARDISLFHRVFLDVVKRHGRAHELELGALYNLRSGHLTANASLLPRMLARRKLAIMPSTIDDIEGVRRIFARARDTWRKTLIGAGSQ
jgi:heterodisulfide reductase subunit C